MLMYLLYIMTTKNKEHSPSQVARETDQQPVSYPADIDAVALKQMWDNEDPRFEDLLDSAAYDFIFENPQFKDEHQANLSVIRSRIAAGSDRKQAAERNRDLFNRVKQIIIDHAGVEGFVIDEIEHARAQIEKIIAEDKKQNGDTSNALTALGILTKDSEGNEVFTYPRRLFPDSTQDKWHTYLSAVKSHIAASDNLKIGGSQSAVVSTDHSRRIAHDSVSRDIQRLLGFEDTEDGFAEARSLAAKMRENRFPTIETAEKNRIENRVQVGLGKVAAFLRDHSDQLYDPEQIDNGHAFSHHESY